MRLTCTCLLPSVRRFGSLLDVGNIFDDLLP